MKALFERVTQLCFLHNMTPRELEMRCGLSRNAIDKWENGSAFVESISKVADYFDVSIDYLAGKTCNPKSHKEPCVLEDEIREFAKNLKQLTFVTQKTMNFMNNYLPYMKDESSETDDNYNSI